MTSKQEDKDGSGADDLSEKSSSSSSSNNNNGSTDDPRTTPMDVGVFDAQASAIPVEMSASTQQPAPRKDNNIDLETATIGLQQDRSVCTTPRDDEDIPDGKAIDGDSSEGEKAKASPTANTSYEQENPSHIDNYNYNKKNSDVEVAIAKAVPCDDDSGDELDIKQIAVATPAPNDDPNTSFCRRHVMVIGGCCVLGIALIILLTLLLLPPKAECGEDGASLCQRTGLERSVTSAPTASPTDRTRETIVTDYLVNELSPEVLVEGTSYSMALDWILHHDPRQLDVDMDRDSKLLKQRYALAVFYFSSTQNGTTHTPWRSCNATSLSLNHSSTENSNATCTYLEPSRSGASLIYKEIPGRIRWLSSLHECEWQGMNCTEKTKEVLKIDVGGQGIKGDLRHLLAGGAGPEKDENNTVSNVLVWGCPKLQLIDMSYNNLTGTIPASFSRFSNLILLELHSNSLSGEIPMSFFDKLTSLQLLNLGENRLSGKLDTKISQLTELRGLHLYQNNFQGQLPSEIGELTSLLTHSRIDGNEFSGPLPTEIGRLTRLTEFRYSNNLFTGTIPTQFGQLTSMEAFQLDGNQLSGTIPVELCNLTNSRVITLDRNALTGSLPTTELSQLQLLISFTVSHNQLTGPIPSQLGDLPKLRQAWLHLNKFTGEMPNEVCEAASDPKDRLDYLQADCDPIDNPPNPCRCCSACCDRSTELCVAATR